MEQKLNRLQQEIKEQYEIPELSVEQVERLKQKMLLAKEENHKERVKKTTMRFVAAAAMVAIILFVLPNSSKTVALAMQQIPLLGNLIELITVRDYEYEDEQHSASIKVGELVLYEYTDVEHMEENVKKELLVTVNEINREIKEITVDLLGGFETSLTEQEGPLAVRAECVVLPSIEQYLVIKLECFMAVASGVEWNYYYTIDLTDGKRLLLEELFQEDSEYRTVLALNIEEQLYLAYGYQLDDYTRNELLRQLEEPSFYVNESGNIVICFDEGDIGSMSMGALEVTIEDNAVKEIRK